MIKKILTYTSIIVSAVSIIVGSFFFWKSDMNLTFFKSDSYSAVYHSREKQANFATSTNAVSDVLHLHTPKAVKAIYMSQCGAASGVLRRHIKKLAETTEINSVVIDVKDYTGTVSFKSDSGMYLSGGKGCVVRDMKELLEDYHKSGIYLIARITVFQDPLYASTFPEYAVHKKTATSTAWMDYHGLEFIDVGAVPFWKYIVSIGREAEAIGFDELNFDYVRYPSDGPMSNIYYSHSDGKKKADELELFFKYLSARLRDVGAHYTPVLSADLFGMTTTNYDDLSIGQVQERAMPYFDYIASMVYPSHYPSWFLNLENPNEHVYEVVKYSMTKAVKRVTATSTKVFSFANRNKVGTGTPSLYKKPSMDKNKLRPWLQDFNYGGVYDATKVRAQIQAVYDSGLSSWMLWDPANRYTREALLAK